MTQATAAAAADALARALDTMAFVALLPVAAPPPAPAVPESEVLAPADLRRVTITLGAALVAQIELLAPQALGALLASNILATGPDDPDAASRADDALMEAMNVTAGLVAAHLAPGAAIEMGIPRLAPATDADWAAFVADGAEVFDADGLMLAIGMKGSD